MSHNTSVFKVAQKKNRSLKQRSHVRCTYYEKPRQSTNSGIMIHITSPSASQIHQPPQSSRGTLEYTVYSRLSNAEMLSPPTVHSGHTFFSASQIFLSMSVRPGTQITEGERNPPHIDYLQPVANLGGQLAHILPVVYGQQHRLDARRQRANQLLLDTACAWSASTHTPCRDRGEKAHRQR